MARARGGRSHGPSQPRRNGEPRQAGGARRPYRDTELFGQEFLGGCFYPPARWRDRGFVTACG
eukprot:scaffold120235_cov48-Phaeocystis_antarctica.AAC.2